MYVAIVLLAASASADLVPRWSVPAGFCCRKRGGDLGGGESGSAAPSSDSKIEHTPLLTTPRNETIVIQAKVLTLPAVRRRWSSRASPGSLATRHSPCATGCGGRSRRACLRASSPRLIRVLHRAQHEQGPATRLGSPRNPHVCVAFDPPPQPVALTIRTAEPGAAVRIDDNDAGRTPVTVRLLPGPHTLAVTGVDGRSTSSRST